MQSLRGGAILRAAVETRLAKLRPHWSKPPDSSRSQFEHNSAAVRSTREGRAVEIARSVSNQAATGLASIRYIEAPEDLLLIGRAADREFENRIMRDASNFIELDTTC